MKEAPKQLEDKDVYEEVQNDPSILINTIMCALERSEYEVISLMISLIT